MPAGPSEVPAGFSSVEILGGFHQEMSMPVPSAGTGLHPAVQSPVAVLALNSSSRASEVRLARCDVSEPVSRRVPAGQSSPQTSMLRPARLYPARKLKPAHILASSLPKPLAIHFHYAIHLSTFGSRFPRVAEFSAQRIVCATVVLPKPPSCSTAISEISSM
jgi:hypothetical protein